METIADMLTIGGKFEAPRKLLAAVLALSVFLLSLHAHGPHLQFDQGAAVASALAASVDEHVPSSHDTLPDGSGETCSACALMRQAPLPTAGSVSIAQVVQFIGFAWSSEQAVPPSDRSEHYRPPITVAV